MQQDTYTQNMMFQAYRAIFGVNQFGKVEEKFTAALGILSYDNAEESTKQSFYNMEQTPLFQRFASLTSWEEIVDTGQDLLCLSDNKSCSSAAITTEVEHSKRNLTA